MSSDASKSRKNARIALGPYQRCNLIFYSTLAGKYYRLNGGPTPAVRAGDAGTVRVGQLLIIELEEAIQSGSKDKRVDALRRITDLFVADAGRLNEQQIAVFDDILEHLIRRIESGALAELSRRLAPIHNAPVEVVRPLAGDDGLRPLRQPPPSSGRTPDDGPPNLRSEPR